MIKKYIPMIGLVLASTASAQLLVYDGFDYGSTLANDDLLAGANGGSGWNGAWGAGGLGAFQTTGLTYTTAGGTLQTTGGALRDIDNTGGQMAVRSYAPVGGGNLINTTDGNSVWFSYLVEWDNAVFTSALFGSDQTAATVELGGTATSEGINRGFGTQAGLDPAPNQDLTAYVGGSTATDRVSVEPGGAILADNISSESLTVGTATTNFILGKVTFSDTAGGDTLELWWNIDLAETAGTIGAADASVFGQDITVNDQQAFAFNSGGGATGTIDELRLGTTFGDVVAVVPEPSSFAFIAGILSLGATALRRRRS